MGRIGLAVLHVIVVFAFCFVSPVRNKKTDNTISLDDAITKLDHILTKRRPWRYGERRRPCGGRRERKEIRQMSKREWDKFTRAVNALKRNGKYDEIAEIHRGPRIAGAHGGAAFLPWHRIYLYVFEELLREEEPCVTIPYWDSTLDFHARDPKDSILWTDRFLGNGKYNVTSGPFANWVTGSGDKLVRDIGEIETLITKERVRNVLSRTRHSQIFDMRYPDYHLELIHNSPHGWVGGQMLLVDQAAEDPVFFLHHAFIDCIWYWFQEKLHKRHRVNSYRDYPRHSGLHGPNRKMDPFAEYKSFRQITNRDGYHRKYYKGVYTCKRMPTCTRHRPSCGSQHLTCDTRNNRCVTREEIKPAGLIMGPLPAIRQGRVFSSPFRDSRTTGHPLPQTLPDLTRFAETTPQLVHNLDLSTVARL